MNIINLKEELFLAMAWLPDRDRKLLEARFLEEKSFDEMSKELGVSRETVRQRLQRALELTKRGIHIALEPREIYN